jgi:nicotinamide-nucleotide adenylyltransferase
MINAGCVHVRLVMLLVRRGLYVGRFQPFHLGHLSAVKEILDEVDELVIVIGSAQYSHNADNPFTAGERLVMIRKALEEAGVDWKRVWVVPVPDVHLHMMWVAEVEGYTPKFSIVYSNDPLTQRLFTEAGYKVKNIPFYDRKVYSSTLIREKMLTGAGWKKLAPKTVAALIQGIDGIARIRDLTKSDKA